MRIEQLNRSIFTLDESHPARKLLEAFLDCLENCVGRHHGLKDGKSIEQEWKSPSEGRVWTFSDFAYAFLSFDIELDGFLQSTPQLTESEIEAVMQLPRMRTLTHECAEAARQSGNHEILELTDEVLRMLNLWEEYLAYRREMISRQSG